MMIEGYGMEFKGEPSANEETGCTKECLELTGFALEGVTDAVFWMSSDGRFRKVNQAACDMLGYSREEFLAMSVAEVNPFLPEDAWQRYWAKLKRSGSLCYEVTLKSKYERVIPVEINANYFHFSDGEFSCAIVKDFTTRQNDDLELWKYRMLFHRMLNGFAICEIVRDADGGPVDVRFREMNHAFEKNIGIKNVETAGMTLLELLPETESHWIERFGKVALTGEPASFIAFHGGLGKHFQTSVFSLGRGEFAVIINDVSDRIRMEQTLLESESREKARASELSALMAAVPATVLIAHDPACRVVSGNQAASEFFRIPAGGNFSKSAPLEERPRHYSIFKSGQETPPYRLPVQRAALGEEVRNYEQEVIFEDGTRRTLLGNATPLRDEVGRIYGSVSAFVDITERKDMEKALRESEEQFRTLCSSAPIGIFKADCEGNKFYSNPRLQEIYGLSSVECRGNGWYRAIHPDYHEEIRRLWREAGTTKRPFSVEYRLTADQGEAAWARALVSPLKDQSGEVTGYVGTVEDITELRLARQEMLKTQKLESLGVLAGGIAHDFNNILTAILGNISLARMHMNDVEKAGRRLVDAENAAARARDLTQQLLTFARGGEPVKRVADIGALLKEAAGFAIHGSSVICGFAVADDLWPAEVDAGQFSQVIHNLVINAVQAMPDGGAITVGAANEISASTGEKCIRIFVADSGTGMPEQHLQRIFDPYFTTKRQGSGLGLATCYSIIKKHGGKITAESAMGKGSTLYIELPAAETEAVADVAKLRALPAAGYGRVLLMDDEEPVRETVKSILEELGYTVECAKDGMEAIALFRARQEEGNPFSAVILDLTIPGGMGGKEAISALRDLDPDVRAVVASGYSTDPVMANYREYGFSAVLCKPFHVQEMSWVLQDLLSGFRPESDGGAGPELSSIER